MVVIIILLALSFFSGVRERVKQAGESSGDWIVSRFRSGADPTRDYLESFVLEYEDPKFRSLSMLAQYPDAQLPRLEQIYLPVRVAYEPTEAERAAMSHAKSPRAEVGVMSGELRERAEPVELTQVIQTSPRLAIVGAAGSGKSTLLQWAGLACARKLLRHTLTKDQSAFVKMLGRAVCPVFIPLGSFDRYCQTKKRERTAAALLDFLTDRYVTLREPRKSRRAAPRFTANFFDRKLRTGCLLLFDGVDEVPPDRREAVRRAIEELLRDYPHARMRALLTSRTRAYAGEAKIADFRRGDVAPLDEDRRNQLIRSLYAYYESNSAVRRSDDLIRSIDASDERVRRLADTPLLTTIFTIVHRANRQLPQQRAELYDEAIKVLLTESHRKDEFAPRSDEAEGDATARRNRLAVIAFHLHLAGRGDEGMPENDLIDLVLADFPTQAADPQQKRQEISAFMHAIANRGGLLTEQDRMFSFRDHRTFQEFLAGWHLVRSYAPQDLKKQAEFLSRHLTDEPWIEPVRLAAGYLAIDSEGEANNYLKMLMELGSTDSERDHAVMLAGLSLADLPPKRVRRDLRDSLASQMLAVFQKTALKPALRRELGLALGGLADPADSNRLFDTRLHPGGVPTLVTIPAGPFRMGTSDEETKRLKEQEVEPFDDEMPQHAVFVSEFAIGKYAVTNAEFRAFMEARGYENQQYWSADGWRWQQGQLEVDLSIYSEESRKTVADWLARRPKEKCSQPFFWDDPNWNVLNLPVVGVTWFEAEAYCNWLSALTGKRFRLSTEAEWEKAARFSPLLVGEGQGVRSLWPRGDTWDPNKCNSHESDFNATTPVGMYPDGASPLGVLDMAGNVWEWCADWWQEDLYQQRAAKEAHDPTGPASGSARVVRGGSWSNNRGICRAACRNWLGPAYFDFDVGFRVALSPVGG